MPDQTPNVDVADSLSRKLYWMSSRDLVQWFAQFPRLDRFEKIAFVISALGLLAFAIGLAWVCWYWAIGEVWNWGFASLGWRSVLGGIAVFYLAITPLVAIPLFPKLVDLWARFIEERRSLPQQVTSARDAQRQIEEELLKNDPHQMVQVLRYSRHMLGEYYYIGMNQAQRSFKYCLIAMWLGFLVLIAGVLDRFGLITEFLPGDAAMQVGAKADANEMVLLSGAVIEFIAAAFLWVYRHSIRQLTYFYSRQLKLHNTLLAHRLACDAGQAKDEALKIIIDRLLTEAETPDSDLPSGGGFRRLLGGA